MFTYFNIFNIYKNELGILKKISINNYLLLKGYGENIFHKNIWLNIQRFLIQLININCST